MNKLKRAYQETNDIEKIRNLKAKLSITKGILEQTQVSHTREIRNMYTLEQIIETWKECYGEDMAEEYAGFLDALQGRGHADDKKIEEGA
jgi:hypothetical protein